MKRAKAGVEQPSCLLLSLLRSKTIRCNCEQRCNFTSNAPENVCRPGSGRAGGAYNAPSQPV